MSRTSPVLDSSSRAATWCERWLLLRDVLGGALVLAAWIALWTVTWAAVAGPLSEGARADDTRVAAVERP